MKIDFSKLQVSFEVKPTSYQEVNVSKELGNLIFQSQTTIEAYRLANKVYDNSEEEYNEMELSLLKEIVMKTNLALPYKRALLGILGESMS